MLRANSVRVLALALWSALAVCVSAYGAPLVPNVSLTAANQSMQQVAASLAKQSGTDIFVVQPPSAAVTMNVSDVPVESALHEAAKQTGCSWVRIYVMEKPDAPLDLETLAALTKLVEASQQKSLENLTDEDRAELMGRPPKTEKAEEAATDAGAGDSKPTEAAGPEVDEPSKDEAPVVAQNVPEVPTSDVPVGAYRAWQDKMAAMGQDPALDSEERNKEYQRWMLGDPLLRLNNFTKREPVPFKVDQVDFAEFRKRALLRTGFVIIGDPETMQGMVSMDFESGSADEIVAAAAEQFKCKWYRLYAVGHVKRLDDEGVKAKRKEMMSEGIRQFLDMSDEERAKAVKDMEEGWQKVPDEAKKMIRESRELKEAMQEFMIYSNTLSMADRAKLTPMMQIVGKIMSGKM